MAIRIDLRYDSDEFDAAVSRYEEAYQKFASVKSILTQCVDSLREGWQSEAGDAFFADFDDDLSPALEKYLNFVVYLKESLQAAKTQYDPVEEYARGIRY